MAGRDEEFQRMMKQAGLGAELGKALSMKTQRQIIFRGCQLVLQAITDQADEPEGQDIIQGYQLLISDPNENRLYLFRFDEDVRRLMEEFCKLPHIGEVVTENNDE